MLFPSLTRIFLVLLFFLFLSCSGKKEADSVASQPVPIIGAGVIFNYANGFYSTSKKTGSVLILNEDGVTGKIVKIINGKIVSTRLITLKDILFTQDQFAATVEGETGIFEKAVASLDKVLSGAESFPDPTLDALCFPAPFGVLGSLIGSTAYKDFRITTEGMGRLFKGLKGTSVETIGGTTPATYTSSVAEVKFTKPGFGSVHIHRTVPYGSNLNYLYTSFEVDPNGVDGAFASAANTFCQLSSRAVGFTASGILADTFSNELTVTLKPDSFTQRSGGGEEVFFSHIYNMSWNVPEALLTRNTPLLYFRRGIYSSYLDLYNFKGAIPLNAKIKQITANVTSLQNSGCVAKGTLKPLDLDSIQVLSRSAGQFITSNAMRQVLIKSGDSFEAASFELVSSTITGPGGLTPAFINSSDFAVSLRWRNVNDCDTEEDMIRFAGFDVKVTYWDR